MFFDFLNNFGWNVSDSKKNWARYDNKSVLVLLQTTRDSYQILMKLEFCQQIFERYSNMQGPGQLSRYGDSLWAGRSGDRISMGRDIPQPSRPALGAHPASYTRVPGLPRKQSGRGVALTTHPHLASRLKKA
jgi:hypothetical protein